MGHYYEIYPDYQPIIDGISIDDIDQGLLSNDYLISSISAIAEFPDRITRLLIQQNKSPVHAYCVAICKTGAFRAYVLDDQFYYLNKEFNPLEIESFAFARSAQHELWAGLIEKAYAKAIGSYWSIRLGRSDQALFDLTGAPCERLNFHSVSVLDGKKRGRKVRESGMLTKKEINVLFEKILDYDQKEFIMTAKAIGKKGSGNEMGIEKGNV